MFSRRLLLAAVLGFACLSGPFFGCADPETVDDRRAAASDDVSRALDSLVVHIDRMILLAESIEDVAAARQAAPTMTQLVEELRPLEERVERLSNDAVYEAHRDLYRLAGAKLRRYREVMKQIAADELMDPDLSEAWLLFLTRG